ncbi:MAG: prolyl oligopeptidase family serine peptidase [Parvularculaceae bacterium]|nr:prolyl oligopeptidase family serine peptidase [Parvularculaceae bacterium]
MQVSTRGAARRMALPVTAASAAALLLSCAGANAARTQGGGDFPAAEGVESVDIVAGGRTRNYLIYVPRSYRPGSPTPLVLAFHGGRDNARNMAGYTRLPELADREGFIVAFPNGTMGKKIDGGTWNTGSGLGQGQAEKRDVNDLAFVRAMIDDIRDEYSIDSRRIYATGMSKGGMMAYTVACNMSDQIAAIAPVAGTMVAAWCEPTSPVAVLHIHGTADKEVPLEGGRGLSYTYPPVQRGIDFWASRDRCSGDQSTRQAGPETTCYTYKGCAREVTLCLVQGGGHAWPGQPKVAKWQKMMKVYVTTSYNASEEAWKFFEQHPKQ